MTSLILLMTNVQLNNLETFLRYTSKYFKVATMQLFGVWRVQFWHPLDDVIFNAED